jgi:protein subunit release factor B
MSAEGNARAAARSSVRRWSWARVQHDSDRRARLSMRSMSSLRTGVEVGNTGAVLDGDLDQFLEAALKAGVN